MFSMAEIRDFIAGLGITEKDHVYLGKLDNKKEKSIGVYSRKRDGPPGISLGGYDTTTYDTKPVSLLIHWNKSLREAEEAAFNLFEKLRQFTSLTVGNTHVYYLKIMVPEPQDVGSDEKGVYEYVIWLDFIYER